MVAEDDHVVGRLRGDVGDPVASRAARIANLQSKNGSGLLTAEYAIVQVTMQVAEMLEEGRHSIVLVRRACKMVRETAPGEVRRDLGLVACVLLTRRNKKLHIQDEGKSTANWTIPKLSMQFPELTPSLPFENRTPMPRTPSTANIFWRGTPLLNTIRHADRLRDVRQTEYVFEPLEIRVARVWQVASENHPHGAADAAVDVRDRIRQGLGVLDIRVRLRAGVARVVPAAVDPHDCVCRGLCVSTKVGHERRKIRQARELIIEAHDPEHILVRHGGDIVGRPV